MTAHRRGRQVVVALVALVIVLAVGIAGVSTFDEGLAPIDDLDLLHGPLDPERSPVEAQLVFALRWLDPSATISTDELRERFSAAFLDAIPLDDLQAERDTMMDDAPYTLRGVLGSERDTMSVSLRSASGQLYVLGVAGQPDELDRIGGLTLFLDEPPGDALTSAQLLATLAAALVLAAGALARAVRRPAPVVPFVALTAVVTVAQVGQLWPTNAAVFWIGVLAGPVALALALPVGWALGITTRRVSRPLGGAAVALAIVGVAPLLGIDAGALDLPAPPIRISSLATTRWLADTRAFVALVAALVVAVLAVRAMMRDRPFRPGALFMIASAALLGALAGNWLTGPGRFDLSQSAWADASLIGVGAAVIAAAFPRRELSGVAQFVSDLGDDAAPRSMEASLREALIDPTAELLSWSAPLGTYVSSDGDRRSPGDPTPGRTARSITAHGEPLGVLVHDASLAIEPGRLTAVLAAARLALDVERLQAEVRARLSEVEASRARIIQAADDARTAVERDLHDGAQQRLLAVLLSLRRLEPLAVGTALEGPLDGIARELGVALEELRTIARGLRPPALDHGIGAALEALAESAPIPVEIEVEPGLGSLGDGVDSAVWFVASEAITNTVRHAGATYAEIRLNRRNDTTTLEVHDDGRGGADVAKGTGLLRLRDRVEALGGRLDLRSTPDEGTTITVTFPSPTDRGETR